MATYRAPLTDIQFLLRNVFHAEDFFSAMPDTQEVNDDLMSAILEEAGKIAEGLLAPINHNGDAQGCRLADGVVTTADGFKEAYKAYADGGWPSLTGDVEFGGQGMPKLLSALIEEMSFGANSSFALFTILTVGATLTLNHHGSQALKEKYLPKMYAGTWSGSMCLTEPHAGTDLGMIYTKAVPDVDDSYLVSGTKIFITAGEHDLSENIIHLVLAKLPDAPAGPRGISLFLVPKFLVNEDGSLGARNAVHCASIEHKMGIKASPTCVMNFENARGYLIGELNKGMSNMFTMMNYERLSMGLQGNGLAESSYRIAVDYASERLQGRAPTGPVLPDKAADPILVHPDVRRMLLTMRSNILGGRALSMYAAMQLDQARFHPDEAARHKAEQLVALLIPVQKAYCSDKGFEACVMGQQILGGHGYVAEWGLEQNVRDARIAQIYEGANGIQALDLMGRKTVRGKGELLQVILIDMNEFIDSQQELAALQQYSQALRASADLLVQTTDAIIANAAEDANEIGAASYAYMELMGVNLYGFMWLRILAAAFSATESGDANPDYLDALIKTGDFFFKRSLPKAKALAEEATSGAGSLMAMRAEQF